MENKQQEDNISVITESDEEEEDVDDYEEDFNGVGNKEKGI